MLCVVLVIFDAIFYLMFLQNTEVRQADIKSLGKTKKHKSPKCDTTKHKQTNELMDDEVVHSDVTGQDVKVSKHKQKLKKANRDV